MNSHSTAKSINRESKILLLALSIAPVVILLLLVETASWFIRKQKAPAASGKEVSTLVPEVKQNALNAKAFSLPVNPPKPLPQLGPKVFYEPTTSIWGNFLLPRENGAVVLPENLQNQDKLMGVQRVWFDVTYTTDEKGHRTTPQALRPKALSNTNGALFLGCSFTFGIGVNDEETLPSQFAQNATGYETWNMGIPGGGPATALRLVETRGIPKDLGKEGFAIFWSIDHHLPRVVGSMQYVGTWGAGYPFYEKRRGDHSLEFVGAYRDAHPLLTILFQLAAKSNFLQLIRFDWPTSFGKEEYELWGKHISKLAATVKNLREGLKLVVVLSPENPIHGETMAEELNRIGVHYLDYRALAPRQFISEPAHYPDGHPTAAYYRFFGKQLAHDLLSAKLHAASR